MAFVELPLGIRVAVEYDLNSELVVNIYHVTSSTPITSVRLASVAQIFLDWFINDMAVEIADVMSLQRVVATDVSEEDGIQHINSPGTPPTGDVVGESQPNNVAVVASLRTQFTGRSFRGRSYIPGLPRTSVADSRITTNKTTDFVTIYNTLLADLDVDDFTLVVASYISNGVARTEAIGTPIETVSVGRIIDTQRRRLPRGA